jgi:hypothetical protein
MTDPARYGRKRTLRHAKKRLEYQRELPLKTSPLKRLELWRSGYRGLSRTIYASHGEAHNEADYLPDTARLETFFLNGSFARGILSDKLLFTKIVGATLPVPEIVALIERGEVFALGEASPPTLKALAARHGSLVLKPSDGTRGRGVHRLENDQLNGKPVGPAELATLARSLDNYLVTKTVAQAAYAQQIFPGSTNSLRVLTLTDPDTGEPFVARAVHRFGSADTVPTDNWSRGGLCANVDPEAGTLGPGVKHAKRTGGRLKWQTHHPDTGAAIAGILVPHWHEVTRALIEAVQRLPFLVYVGWDVVVTETGFCVLEGNNNTDLDLLQVHGGLLRDVRVRRFYEHHGVAPKR